MKRHLSTVVGTCLGLCAGFTLCYICLVLPHREAKATASAPGQILQQEKTTITIARDGSLYLAGEPLDLNRLATRLKALGAQRPITIRADSRTAYKRLVEVMDACKAAAVSQIAIATATTR
jgi:biopolymer transport protein ExbD